MKAKKPTVAHVLGQRSALVFKTEDQLRQAVFDTASKFVGLRERTGNNDANWIAIINRLYHLPDKAHYCASAYNYVHAMNGVRLPVSDPGRVAAYFRNSKTITYKGGGRGNQRMVGRVRLMDAVSLFASHIEGIAQTDFDPDEDDYVMCLGFNTTAGKGTKGGCYINRRRTRDIKAIANWISPYWRSLHPNE